ncbi:hypothetical protein AAH678_28345 [Sodalis endosymbiont of Spalangia cameroni]|uniref:IS66 family insertion sequence element accessory protein TnpA n=1 Tax=Sodalis praecaptivus TaxID=1239307 RepID=UPI0031F99590
MRTNRTRDEWNSIFGAHARSGLSQNEFCRKRGITPSAFSNAKQRISAGQAHKSAFVPVLPPQPSTEESTRSDTVAELPSGRAAISTSQTVSPISVLLPGATLCLSADISPRWLATLIREMAQ